MIYVQNNTQLDTLARKIGECLKVPVTRVKSAIAKAEGFEHISTLLSAFNTITPPEASSDNKLKRSHAMEQFTWWLRDNIDMGSNIHFDNEGEIDSSDILAEIELLEVDAAGLQQLLVEFDAWWLAQVSRPDLLAASQKESIGYESDDAFYEGTEDAITTVAMSLADDPKLTAALAVLQLHGLSGISDKLKELAIDGVVFKHLN